MNNNRESEELIKPLIEEEHIEIKDKYSLRILVFFTGGKKQTEEEVKSYQTYLNHREKKGYRIICASPQDFEGDRLKSAPAVQEKYQIFSKVNSRTKIQLCGHGDVTRRSCIFSAGGESYNADKLMSIFNLIEDDSVRVAPRAKELKSLSKEHLHISILSCFAENIAIRLKEKLDESTSPDGKRWLLSITAGKKDMVMVNVWNQNRKYYKTLCGYKAPKYARILAVLSFLGAAGLTLPCIYKSLNNEESSVEYGYGALAFAGVSLLSYLASWVIPCDSATDTDNSGDKIVIYTDFEKNSQSNFTQLPKNMFIKEMNKNIQTENPNSLEPPQSLTSSPTEFR